MTSLHPQQMRTAIEELERARARWAKQQKLLNAMDEKLADALGRIERGLEGLDVHKFLADRLTDDEQHPVTQNQVHDWLNRRNGRRVPAELVLIVCELDDEFARWWSDAAGLQEPKRKVLLSAEERAEQLEADLLDFGPAGAKKLEQRKRAWSGKQLDLGIAPPTQRRTRSGR